MQIISFAWTDQKLLQGLKTVTRRRWKKCWVKPGDLVQAWDKSPRYGGKKIAIIKIISVREERLCDITEEEVIKEGGLWSSPYHFIQSFLGGYPGICDKDLVWRIEFKLVSKEERRNDG